MSADKDMPQGLWAPRTVDDTLKLYADWAGSYEADVAAYGYVTPARVARALAAQTDDKTAPVFDFGCGTGLSGAALTAEGFTTLDGTDISAEMMAQAKAKGVYKSVFAGEPGAIPDLSPYAAVTATGVISLGAAPAETLAALLGAMTPGSLLALSYNDATLLSADYLNALADVQSNGTARLLTADYGPHLPEKDGARGSTVYVLRRL